MRQVGGWKPSEVKIHTLGMVIHKWEDDYHFSNSPQIKWRVFLNKHREL